MAGPGEELYAGVLQAVEGTPYQVTPAEDGFEVTVNLPDRRWQSLFEERRLSQVFSHRVRVVDEQARKLSVTDELRQVERSAGLFQLGASVGVSKGRIYRKSFGAAPAGNWVFDSEEGRRLVTDTAKRLGWSTVRGAAEKIGLVAGVAGVGAAVVTLVALLVAFLAGAF